MWVFEGRGEDSLGMDGWADFELFRDCEERSWLESYQSSEGN
jgi:hypothetical protein